jgi:uncharacterized protein (TIGR02646 family)
VNKPNKGKLKWEVAEKTMIMAYIADSTPFIAGLYPFSHAFGKEEFRDALENCQGPKCCFCEKPIYNGAIEHFRPKKAWQQTRGGALNRPGYYWLAYSWSNMLLSCTECNQADQKGNLFPVNGLRATDHTMDCEAEQNLIINPSVEDPSISITFTGSIPIHNNLRGKFNIELFKLDTRGDLVPIRKDRFELYKTLKDIAGLAEPVGVFTQLKINEAKAFIHNAAEVKAPFAGMIIENIKNGTL